VTTPSQLYTNEEVSDQELRNSHVIRISFRAFYQARGACLRSYNALWSLHT